MKDEEEKGGIMNRFRGFLSDFSRGFIVIVCLLAGATRLHSAEEVWAWGRNGYGQLGDNTTTYRLEPVQTHNITDVIAIAAGWDHSLALKSDGTVWAWGWNLYGQLGDSTWTNRVEPVQTHILTDAIVIAAGGDHSLALKSDGTVWAWGGNWEGQLGDSTTTNRFEPVQTHILTDIIAIAGGGYHSLALKFNGTVWAWGHNWSGQLGDSTWAKRLEPVQTHILTGIDLIAAGYQHSLAAGNVAGIEESENERIMDYKLQAYPNPFTTGITVKYSGISGGQEINLQIYDLSGRLVNRCQVSGDRCQIGENLKPGIYFLKVKGYKPVKVMKLK